MYMHIYIYIVFFKYTHNINNKLHLAMQTDGFKADSSEFVPERGPSLALMAHEAKA